MLQAVSHLFKLYSPWQHTKYKVKHEEGANDDEGDEVQPVPCVPWGIIGLNT